MAISNARLDPSDERPHYVALYGDDVRRLGHAVAKYLADGFDTGCTGVIVTASEHNAVIYDGLAGRGWSSGMLEREGLLTILDARKTLSKLMNYGLPDANRFDHIVGTEIRAAVDRSGGAGTRAFGEMVGLLWQEGEFPAAIRLEQLWNQLLEKTRFDLFCAYPVDVFDKAFDAGVLDAVLCAHTHLVPSMYETRLQAAVDRAMREVLDCSERRRAADGCQHRPWAALPPAESAILWLRKNVPEQAEDVLARARRYFEALPARW